MIFINPSQNNESNIFKNFTPSVIPFGMGYLMEILHNNNIKTAFIDAIHVKDVISRVGEIIEEFEKPYIFGFNVLTISYNHSVQLSRRLKEIYPESYVVFGGVHSSVLPDDILANDYADVVVKGEAEKIIFELYDCLKNNRDLSDIGNISFKKNDIIIHNPISSCLIELDELPKFPFYLFNKKDYELSYIMSSRGCPHSCIFCSNNIHGKKRYRFHSTDRIMDEMLSLYHDYDCRHIKIYDDNFLVDKGRLIELAERIKTSEMFGKVIFSFQARADNASKEILQMLYEVGFRGVYFGIETASETLLANVKKGETISQIKDAILIAKNIGYYISGNFIFGLPGETHKDRMDAIRLSKSLDLDLVKYNNLIPFPGTEMFFRAKEENSLHITGLYENFSATATMTENPFKKIKIAYLPYGNSENQLRFDILYATIRYYFNWRKLKRVFSRSEYNHTWFNFELTANESLNKIKNFLILLFFLTVKFSEAIVRYPFVTLNTYFRNKKNRK